MMDLNVIWFVLLFVLFAVYAVLDGFDLGVGILHLFARNDDERRVGLNAIGPVWDGNEVWLITAGAVLFSAFPPVYAALFSGMYLALMLLLLALIARAVSMEFRGKVHNNVWKRVWDMAFGLGSFVIALLFSVALGNLLRGVPIDKNGEFTGSFLGLLNPYSVVVGVTGVVLLVLHGATYLAVKSEGDLHVRSQKVAGRLWIVFALLYAICFVWSMNTAGHLFENWGDKPIIWLLLIMLVVGVALVPIGLKKLNDLLAFAGTSITVFAAVVLCGAGLFPYFALSTIDKAYSLDTFNGSSSQYTLKTMLIITSIGLPLVIVYTVGVYWIFRGKVKLTKEGY